MMFCVLMITEEVLGDVCDEVKGQKDKKREGDPCNPAKNECCNIKGKKELFCLGLPGLEKCKTFTYGR